MKIDKSSEIKSKTSPQQAATNQAHPRAYQNGGWRNKHPRAAAASAPFSSPQHRWAFCFLPLTFLIIMVYLFA